MSDQTEREARYAKALHLRYPFEASLARDEVRAVIAIAEREARIAGSHAATLVDRAVTRAEAAEARVRELEGAVQQLRDARSPESRRWRTSGRCRASGALGTGWRSSSNSAPPCEVSRDARVVARVVARTVAHERTRARGDHQRPSWRPDPEEFR